MISRCIHFNETLARDTYLHLQIIERSMTCVEQFLQVLVEIFEDESEFSVRMKYIDEPHNIRMLELLQQGDLSDSSGRNTLILRLETNLLQRINLVGIRIARLVNNTVGALANHLNLLVLVNLRFHYFLFFVLLLLR